MARSMERSYLHVEGKDDLHAIVNLLVRHGLDYDARRSSLPEFREIGSCEKILAGMETAVSLSTGRTIGFVLDADSAIESRWNAVRDRLLRVDVVVPATLPPQGLIVESARYKSRVGVWLMPDNQREGTLESFLKTLVDTDDSVFHHAVKATEQAKAIGATFRSVAHPKAEIHAWLAWQEEPGLPYGSAIRAQYFGHDSPAALAFVQWFRQLYALT